MHCLSPLIKFTYTTTLSVWICYSYTFFYHPKIIIKKKSNLIFSFSKKYFFSYFFIPHFWIRNKKNRPSRSYLTHTQIQYLVTIPESKMLWNIKHYYFKHFILNKMWQNFVLNTQVLIKILDSLLVAITYLLVHNVFIKFVTKSTFVFEALGYKINRAVIYFSNNMKFFCHQRKSNCINIETIWFWRELFYYWLHSNLRARWDVYWPGAPSICSAVRIVNQSVSVKVL